MKYKKIILGSLMLLAVTSLGSLMLVSFAPATGGQLIILSGSKQATQYDFVQDIISIVGPSLDFKVMNKESKGAADNFKQLSDPKSPYKIAILQADYLYYMKSQDMRNNEETTKDLTVLLPLGDQQIHLVAKANTGVTGLQSLNGKKVAIGSLDQGTYRTAMLIKDHANLNFVPVNTSFEDGFRALSVDDIAAFFIVSSAPIEKLDLNPQSMTYKMTLVPLQNINDWAKFYKPDTIRKGEYKWLEQDVPTYSVATVLVVNESKLTSAERDQVTKLKAGIQSNYEALKAKGHPEWKQVNLSDWNESNWPSFK